MSQKGALGQTKKYSKMTENIKKTQSPEEPRITPEQVIAAFRSFGFEPNERNHNDIGYWTTKGQSEGVKLMEELHKRRMDINQKEDDDIKVKEINEKKNRESKSTLPRLSDEDLTALFDEYGLPSPDMEWARNHLPNDPKKIRSILEMQRKTADDMLKKQAKNTVNAIPETPKMSAMPTAGAPMMGMGGPTPNSPMGMQGEMTGMEEPVTPFFVGENALVKITSPQNPNSGTLWLVDSKRKVLRPILSEKALENAFEDPQEALNSIVTLSSKALGPGGALEGFTPLKSDKAMMDDGSMEDIEFSQGQIQKRYGQSIDPTAENKALSTLDGVLNNINKPQV